MTIARAGPEIVFFAVDELDPFLDGAGAVHMVFKAVDGLPSGRHDAAFAEIVFFLADRGKTCFSACFGVYIVDFAFHGDPAGLFTAFRVIEPFAGCIFPAGKSGRFRSHRFHRGQR